MTASMTTSTTIDPGADLPCTCFRLRSAARRTTAFYERALRPSGLKITQYSLLANLARSGPLSVTALARLLATDRTTLTRNLTPLERDGLIDVADGPDARTRSVNLTRKGHAAFDAAIPLWREAQRAMKQALGPEDTAQLHDLLGRAQRASLS
jgi:DNA-binding MarR family transcriptional regulator